MKQKPADTTVENEAKNGLKNEPYTLAMARTSAPHSASAQFFINVKNNSFLDYPGQDGWGYAVFGKVTDGTDVVDAIRKVKTTRSGMFADVPTEDVIIEKVELAA
jgi:peptidyl-prolyl cis-trans isomerase B (cyclophilin B)